MTAARATTTSGQAGRGSVEGRDFLSDLAGHLLDDSLAVDDVSGEDDGAVAVLDARSLVWSKATDHNACSTSAPCRWSGGSKTGRSPAERRQGRVRRRASDQSRPRDDASDWSTSKTLRRWRSSSAGSRITLQAWSGNDHAPLTRFHGASWRTTGCRTALQPRSGDVRLGMPQVCCIYRMVDVMYALRLRRARRR